MGNIRGNRATLISILDEDGNWWEVNLKDNTATKINQLEFFGCNVLTKDDEGDIILNRLKKMELMK
jgi:hypothetical protein